MRAIFSLSLATCLSLPLCAQSLIVSEIMADPTPSRGLPQTEYIELFHTGTQAENLAVWFVASGGRAVPLSAEPVSLNPGQFALLVDAGYRDSFPTTDGPVLELNLPGLTNSGDVIELYRNDTLAFTVTYSDDWYQDPARDDGGYSLAFVGGPPNCPGSWRASGEEIGGSPGKRNSVAGQPLDVSPPRVVGRKVYTDSVVIRFDESVVREVDPLLYLDGLPLPTYWPDERTLVGYAGFATTRIDTLLLLPDYADCSGNRPTRQLQLPVLLPTPIRNGELLLNELLFDPLPGGQDYVELYNASPRPLDLNGLQLSNPVSSTRVVSVSSTLLLPAGEFAVLTPDSSIFSYWSGARGERTVFTALPSLPNAGGELLLLGPTGEELDRMTFDDEMQADLIGNPEGVALERISHLRPAALRTNWTSGSSLSGYGTPTRLNSQNELPTQRQHIELVERTFSPNGDGVMDKLAIRYTLDEPGTYATVRIYDSAGLPVRELNKIALLGTSGELYWDGTLRDGTLAPAGPYVVLLRLFTDAGDSYRRKLLTLLVH
jgi:hypothetical protein